MRCEKVAERVAAQRAPRGPGKLPRDAGLRDDGERLYGRRIAALDERLRRLTSLEVDGRERLHQRRQRFHRRADDDLLAVRAPALDAARVVGLPVQAALIVAQDLVVRVRAALPRQLESLADLDALDRLRPHQRERQPRIEPFLLRRVRAETRWDAAR